MAKDPMDIVRDMVSRHGRAETKRLLVMAGASPSTADKMTRDKYDYEVGLLLKGAVLRAQQESKRLKAS